MLHKRLDAENNPALWELESFIHYKNIIEVPFGQALVLLEEIQSSNKLTVCGGNEIPDMLGKHRLSELEPAERMWGRAPASRWREEQIRLPGGEVWVPLCQGARGSVPHTRLCNTARGSDVSALEMCAPAGDGGRAPHYEGLHGRAWSSCLLKSPREPLTIDTPYQLSPWSAGQARRQPPSSTVLVIQGRMTSYSKTWRPETTNALYYTASGSQECRWGSAACLWLQVAIGLRLKGKCWKVPEGCVPKLTLVTSQCKWWLPPEVSQGETQLRWRTPQTTRRVFATYSQRRPPITLAIFYQLEMSHQMDLFAKQK